ncbi:MAG: hypothetical protein DDT23_01313 [candidate division WS2 bacterium]|nr:hypothetical protein [Candidatus Lithacetigena glycinireducens]
MRLTMYEVRETYNDKDVERVVYNHTPMSWQTFVFLSKTLSPDRMTETKMSEDGELTVLTDVFWK